MIETTDDDGRKTFHYAWCETCGEPVHGSERVDEPEELRSFPIQIAAPANWVVWPCGHGTWSTKHPLGIAFTVGLVTTVGESFAPFPGISIAGFDPSKTYDPPVPIP